MTFRQFALHNVFRNKRLYVAYFFSSMFAVMVFFTFANFAFHPAFQEGDMPSSAMKGMLVAGGIIYVFSFFFILYSMSSFLQSRKREFGLLMLLGMSSRQVKRMTFIENMVIGIFATTFGIGFGLIFSKVILLIAENVLVIDETLNFYFPTKAILLSFVSFVLLFLVISFFVTFVLRTKKLVELIKADKQSKGEPKASLLLTILAAILLIGGYGVALYVKGTQVVIALIPVAIVVIIGTYFFFTQLSVFVIRRLKKNKQIFWKKTNMLLFSDLSFRMKDNARTFFMVAIISTVAFSAIGTLFGFRTYLTKGIVEATPYSIIYNSMEGEDVKAKINDINNILSEENVKADQEVIENKYYETGVDYPVLIVKASEYNRLAKLIDEDLVDPKENQAIVVGDHHANINTFKNDEKLMKTKIPLKDGKEIQAFSTISSSIINEMQAYYIINDNEYKYLPEPVKESTLAAWVISNATDERLVAVGEKVSESFNKYNNAFSIDYNVYVVDKAYGPILFIGLFIGIVFFVSAGSFLYFRLYSDLDNDQEKFKAITKLGLTKGELKKVISRQTAILFFAPIIVALVHGAVALTALMHLFDYNLVRESAIVLGVFAFIQVVYFFIVRHFYTKQIQKAL
ncbi:MAG TPA: ABC transporter permease [Cerasibacillus sp.]|uniref:ABC transporter permease n=1 Tax=Cerasibacillus sp. TaxID=2498711 RepID=UPI002F3F73D0